MSASPRLKRRHSTAVVCVAVGFVLICVLGELRVRAVETELQGHRSLAHAAVTRATVLLSDANRLLDGPAPPRSDSSGAKSDSSSRKAKALATPDSDERRIDVEQNLAAASALDALALDVLDHMQQIGHAMSRGFDSSLTANVAQAAGQSVLTKLRQDRFTRVRDSVWKNWRAAGVAYQSTLGAENTALGHATDAADLSLVPGWFTHPWVRLNIVLADAFMGRSPTEFVVKLLYAVTFLLICGGIALVTARLLGAMEPDQSLTDIINDAMKNSPSLAAVAPLIAPIGLVAVLAGGYAVAQSSSEDPATEHEHGGHIQVLASRDTLRRLVAVPDTAGQRELRDAIGGLRDSVGQMEALFKQMNDTVQEIAKRAK